MAKQIESGEQAECAAANYLQQHGLKLVASNFRCRFGEIDLIMRNGETLVFIEVRKRSHPQFGGAATSINTRTQSKLIATGQLYLADLKTIPVCRFDAVLVDGMINSNGSKMPLRLDSGNIRPHLRAITQ